MIIDLRTLSAAPRRYQLVFGADWWSSDEKKDQIRGIDRDLDVEISIYRAGDKFVLDGNMVGGLEVACDRCLVSFHQELKSGFRVFLSLPVQGADQTEVDLIDQDLEVDFIRTEEVDLDEIIREQIYLSLPMKSLCSEGCLGLCPFCGVNLNKGSCQCQRELQHPAFLKLKDMKTQGE
jgi:uncharacterized protein